MSFEESFASIEKRARADGAAVEMMVERADRLAISFQQSQLNKFDSSSETCAGFRVVLGEGAGYSYSENLSPESLASAYDAALENARFSSTGARLLSDAGAVEELAGLFNDSLSALTIEDKIEQARLLESAALQADSRVTAVPYGGYSETEGELFLYSSEGIRRRQRWTAVSLASYALAKSGEESRSGHERLFTRDASALDASSVAARAAESAVSKLGAAPPDTGVYSIVLEMEPARTFIGMLSEYFSAKALDEKRSLFAGRLGEMIAAPCFSLRDDPFYAGGVQSRAFDSEGARASVTPIVSGGRFDAFLTNSHLSVKLGLPHTANGARGPRSVLDVAASNLVVSPGVSSVESLLGSSPRVIYVRGVTGIHAGFRPGSGDFSLQSEGELWENGRFVRPLCNFVISGNVRDLLMNLEAVSSRVETPKSGVVAPDFLVRGISVAGR